MENVSEYIHTSVDTRDTLESISVADPGFSHTLVGAPTSRVWSKQLYMCWGEGACMPGCAYWRGICAGGMHAGEMPIEMGGTHSTRMHLVWQDFY